MRWVGLQCVIVVFWNHTHLLFGPHLTKLSGSAHQCGLTHRKTELRKTISWATVDSDKDLQRKLTYILFVHCLFLSHTRLSFQEVCRDLFCTPPKTLQGRKCIDMVNYVTGVTYEAFLELVPVQKDIPVAELTEVASSAWDVYYNHLVNLGVSYSIYENTLYVASSNRSTEEVIRSFVLHFKVYFNIDNTQSNTFVNSLLDLQNETRVYSSEQFERVTQFEMKLIHIGSSADSLQIVPDVVPTPDESGLPNFVEKSKPTLITKTLRCPLIKLDENEYNIEQGSMKLNITGLGEKCSPNDYLVKNISGKTVLFICAENYISILERFQKNNQGKRPTSSDNVTPQGKLSLICTSISLLCLLLTLLTYLLFRDLRTQPGINNMALVICLIVAQSLFQFGIGQAGKIEKWACQVIGVLVHFFWLAAILWMNVCCIHMLKVFLSINNTAVAKKAWKQTFIYLAYTLTVSTVFVLINIIVSVSATDNEEIGYGGEKCFITEHYMIAYMFAIPVGLAIVSNMVMFIIVVVKICRTPTVKSDTQHTRNVFAVYAKLSTITGITWLFGFIYTFTKIEALEYIFIIVNATQGLFIFLAFVCNRRVFRMYSYKFSHLKSGFSRSMISKSMRNSRRSTKTTVTYKYTTKTAL